MTILILSSMSHIVTAERMAIIDKPKQFSNKLNTLKKDIIQGVIKSKDILQNTISCFD